MVALDCTLWQRGDASPLLKGPPVPPVPALLDLASRTWPKPGRTGSLWTPPEIHRRHPVHAADRAIGGAGFRRRELASNVVDSVRLERHAGVAALLRAVVHEA